MLSYGKAFNTDYRLRYARCVLDLDSMNKEMAMYVEGIQTYCLEVCIVCVNTIYNLYYKQNLTNSEFFFQKFSKLLPIMEPIK